MGLLWESQKIGWSEVLDAVEKGVGLSREELVGKARYGVIYGVDLSLATGRFEKTLNKNCFYRCKKAPQAEI